MSKTSQRMINRATTSSGEEVWTTDFVDDEGTGLASSTISSGHRITPLIPSGTPMRSGAYSNLPDTHFPISEWSTSLKFWFDAASVGGMTFATGDAEVGGTVSAWVDVTGSVTMNTTVSGDSAVNYNVNVKGFPSISGGTSGTPRSLESANVTYSGTTGHQRLFWAVVDFTQTIDNAPCAPFGNNIFPYVDNAFDSDIGSITNVPTSACAGTTIPSIPMSIQEHTDGLHVFVWRITVGATYPTIERYYAGRLAHTETGTTAACQGTSIPCGVGALPDSTNDSEGSCYEMGAVDGAGTSITDAQVEDLVRYLCNKYDVDFMSDTTPMDIGLMRSTAALAQTDCCLWYRSDYRCGEVGEWFLKDECASLHTSPDNFVLAEEGTESMTYSTGNMDRRACGADETVLADAHLGSAYTYTSSETTDFPADTDGVSAFYLLYTDSATTTNDGARVACDIMVTRYPASTTNVALFCAGGQVQETYTDVADKWAIAGAVIPYDDDGSGGTAGYPGSTDGSPAAYVHFSDEAVRASDNDGGSTSFPITQRVNWGISDGVVKCAEIMIFKHPLTNAEVAELKKYYRYKYNDPLT